MHLSKKCVSEVGRRTESHSRTRASPSTSNKSASPTTPDVHPACPDPTRLCISCPPQHAVSHFPNYSKEEPFIRDVFLSLGDLECVRVRSEVDRPPCTAHLAADRAHTKLIRHWCAGLDRESHGPTVTTSLELDWHDLSSRKRGL